MSRPDSFAGGLRSVAEFLDEVDVILKSISDSVGHRYEVSDVMQQDLREMADRIESTVMIGPALNDMWMQIAGKPDCPHQFDAATNECVKCGQKLPMGVA